MLFSGEDSHLERYARMFSCVEVNSSFYRSHRPATYARWAASTPESFCFSVKAPKTITHLAGLLPASAVVDTFLREVRHLGEKLGPILFQFPPRQSFDVPRVRDFFQLLRDLYPEGDVVVEPRHATWFCPEAEGLLEKFQLARVVADPPPVPEAVKPSQSTLRYYRLHGWPRVYYSRYPEEYLKELALQIVAAQAKTWCIFDNTALGAATANALVLRGLLGASAGAGTDERIQ